MLHLFRRADDRGHAPLDVERGPVFSSHILARFLKRLRAMERPHLLDLGSLSDVNIEFFGRSRCKVQVEDLLGPHLSSTDAEASELLPVPLSTTPEISGPAGEPLSDTPSSAATEPTRSPMSDTQPGARSPAILPPRPGSRPTRRIVLPPRRFGNGGSPPGLGQSAGSTVARPGAAEVRAGPARASAGRCRLPTSFGYPDETFDAVVAWDIFNFYDPESARLITAETRRVLKPGGLVLCYFHAKRLEGLDAPRRYRIMDERRVACESIRPVRQLARHVYQNRDIEKMFAGLAIIELYFLKNSLREILMEKRPERTLNPRPLVRPATPKPPRFTIE